VPRRVVQYYNHSEDCPRLCSMSTLLERYLNIDTPVDLPVKQEEKVVPKAERPLQDIAEAWLAQFNEAITKRNAEAVAALFQKDGDSSPYPLC
jgi:hypothetical protein